MKDFRRPFWCASALGALVLFALVRTGLGDLDSPEITASLTDMGQMHPPGHPSYMGSASIALWIPFGTLSFRVAFFSFLCLIFSAGVLAEIVARIRPEIDSQESWWMGLLIPTTFGVLAVLVPGVSEQGIRPEVYALHILLTSSALYGLLFLLDERDHQRWLITVGLLEGLALANHHYLTVLALGPATLWVLLRDGGAKVQRLGWAFLGLGLGLLPYLSLALKDPTQSELFWADTRSFNGFWETISAQAFQGSIGSEGQAGFGANVGMALGMLWRFLGIIPFFLGLLGLGLLVRSRSPRALLFLMVLVGALLSKSIMFTDPNNPDDRGYLSMAFVLWVLFGAFALYALRDALASWLSRAKSYGVLTLLCLLTMGHTLGASVEMADADPPSGQLTPLLLEDVPASTLVLSYHYQTHFLLQHGLFVEGRRPDLVEIQMNMGGPNAPAHRAHFSSRHPDYAPISEAYGRVKGFPLADLVRTVENKSIAVEPVPEYWGLGHLNDAQSMSLNRDLLTWSKPGFAFHVWGGDGSRSRCGFPRRKASMRRIVSAPVGLGLRSQLGFIFLERTLFQIRRGDARCARQDLEFLKELAGDGATLKKLEDYVARLEASADQDGVDPMRPYERLGYPLP